MTAPANVKLRVAKRVAGLAAIVLSTFLAGCAGDSALMGSGAAVTASDKTRMTQSGFLSDYSRLKAVPWGDGIECWREDAIDVKSYRQVLVSRIVVSLVPPKDQSAPPTIDPSDLKTLTDYFHASMIKALKPQMPIADTAGPGVVVIRIALTDLVPTKVTDSLAGSLIPYGFVVEAGSGAATGRPAGSTPYMGETGMEMQFLDGGSGAVLAECRDTEIGRKYAGDVDSGTVGAAQTWASGYLNSFEAWSYAKNAFDKWSLLVAKRLAEVRSAKQ